MSAKKYWLVSSIVGFLDSSYAGKLRTLRLSTREAVPVLSRMD